MPAEWEARVDAIGQTFYLNAGTGESTREHPLNAQYRRTFYACKLEAVGYRQLMLSRIDSRGVVDALGAMPEQEKRRMEVLFEQHDRDRDVTVAWHTNPRTDDSAFPSPRPLPSTYP